MLLPDGRNASRSENVFGTDVDTAAAVAVAARITGVPPPLRAGRITWGSGQFRKSMQSLQAPRLSERHPSGSSGPETVKAPT